MSKPIKVPLAIYETLHLHALAFGGIGAGRFCDGKGMPLCAIGMLRNAVKAPIVPANLDEADRMMNHAWSIGITPLMNDAAVDRINVRKGKKGQARLDRVTFEEWCAEMNVVPAAE